MRVRAAEFPGLIGVSIPRPVIFETLKHARSPTEADLTLNTVALLPDSKSGHRFDQSAVEFPKDWMISGKSPSFISERLAGSKTGQTFLRHLPVT